MSGEPPPAPGPAADVGLLPGVGPDVSLEVGGLDVVLGAPLKCAGEHLLVLFARRGVCHTRLGFDFLFVMNNTGVTCIIIIYLLYIIYL